MTVPTLFGGNRHNVGGGISRGEGRGRTLTVLVVGGQKAMRVHSGR